MKQFSMLILLTLIFCIITFPTIIHSETTPIFTESLDDAISSSSIINPQDESIASTIYQFDVKTTPISEYIPSFNLTIGDIPIDSGYEFKLNVNYTGIEFNPQRNSIIVQKTYLKTQDEPLTSFTTYNPYGIDTIINYTTSTPIPQHDILSFSIDLVLMTNNIPYNNTTFIQFNLTTINTTEQIFESPLYQIPFSLPIFSSIYWVENNIQSSSLSTLRTFTATIFNTTFDYNTPFELIGNTTHNPYNPLFKYNGTTTPPLEIVNCSFIYSLNSTISTPMNTTITPTPYINDLDIIIPTTQQQQQSEQEEIITQNYTIIVPTKIEPFRLEFLFSSNNTIPHNVTTTIVCPNIILDIYDFQDQFHAYSFGPTNNLTYISSWVYEVYDDDDNDNDNDDGNDDRDYIAYNFNITTSQFSKYSPSFELFIENFPTTIGSEYNITFYIDGVISESNRTNIGYLHTQLYTNDDYGIFTCFTQFNYTASSTMANNNITVPINCTLPSYINSINATTTKFIIPTFSFNPDISFNMTISNSTVIYYMDDIYHTSSASPLANIFSIGLFNITTIPINNITNNNNNNNNNINTNYTKNLRDFSFEFIQTFEEFTNEIIIMTELNELFQEKVNGTNICYYQNNDNNNHTEELSSTLLLSHIGIISISLHTLTIPSQSTFNITCPGYFMNFTSFTNTYIPIVASVPLYNTSLSSTYLPPIKDYSDDNDDGNDDRDYIQYDFQPKVDPFGEFSPTIKVHFGDIPMASMGNNYTMNFTMDGIYTINHTSTGTFYTTTLIYSTTTNTTSYHNCNTTYYITSSRNVYAPMSCILPILSQNDAIILSTTGYLILPSEHIDPTIRFNFTMFNETTIWYSHQLNHFTRSSDLAQRFTLPLIETTNTTNTRNFTIHFNNTNTPFISTLMISTPYHNIIESKYHNSTQNSTIISKPLQRTSTKLSNSTIDSKCYYYMNNNITNNNQQYGVNSQLSNNGTLLLFFTTSQSIPTNSTIEFTCPNYQFNFNQYINQRIPFIAKLLTLDNYLSTTIVGPINDHYDPQPLTIPWNFTTYIPMVARYQPVLEIKFDNLPSIRNEGLDYDVRINLTNTLLLRPNQSPIDSTNTTVHHITLFKTTTTTTNSTTGGASTNPTTIEEIGGKYINVDSTNNIINIPLLFSELNNTITTNNTQLSFQLELATMEIGDDFTFDISLTSHKTSTTYIFNTESKPSIKHSPPLTNGTITMEYGLDSYNTTGSRTFILNFPAITIPFTNNTFILTTNSSLVGIDTEPIFIPIYNDTNKSKCTFINGTKGDIIPQLDLFHQQLIFNFTNVKNLDIIGKSFSLKCNGWVVHPPSNRTLHAPIAYTFRNIIQQDQTTPNNIFIQTSGSNNNNNDPIIQQYVSSWVMPAIEKKPSNNHDLAIMLTIILVPLAVVIIGAALLFYFFFHKFKNFFKKFICKLE